MRIRKFLSLPLAVAMTGFGLAEAQMPNARDSSRIEAAVKRLEPVPILALSGDFQSAEREARSAIDEIDSAGGNSRLAHVALGKVLIFEGKYDDAVLEAGAYWKPAKNWVQDLLVAFAGCKSDNPDRTRIGQMGLIGYVLGREAEERERFGDYQFDYYSRNLKYMAGTAALLYASADETNPNEALWFIGRAETLLPHDLHVRYAKSLIELKLHRYDQARADLNAVSREASPLLAEKATATLKSMDARE